MHPNKLFHGPTKAENIAFTQKRSFGVLSINGDDGPLMSHVPFQLSADGTHLEAHLVRSNPIIRALVEPVNAVVAVSGGDGYISPDWYEIDNQVPTWNYIAVHLRGTLTRLEDDALHGILERLSQNFEERLLPKTPWTIDKMDEDIYAKMLRQIVPAAMQISDIDATWKLSQNKSSAVRLGAAKGVKSAGIGSETTALAELMKQVVVDE